ncbi:Myxococcales GC_trans_RRR domain-containing protein/PGF-CTERM protein [Halogranum gelatinilyticum]|uniref:Myxococcales GC_trans_RRR domain-containing protein/PGF-CTERM protein n=1 Tax=Halogranum gelatinilyticum TaxID=660521 RepID=A0A1G9UJB7_9EURY|nr:PGF-CTERM sorting domain-containing protein [Halogranum gelatinilyticum]SDM59988.1 Myxococcales GC_trans_RRR domain-containing protein/PGF-CTERM protein [Halogranum gelatinilyticum]
MNRETALTAGAVGIVAVALLVAGVVPGVLADPTDRGPLPPGRVDIADGLAIQPNEVSGETTTLRVETRLSHRGNTAENVTVRFRAVDAESGFVETTETVALGNLTEDGEIPVRADLTVEREGGYRIETTVFRDSERVDSGRTTVSGLDALTPAYARTSVGFTDSDVLPPVAVSVADAGDERTTLRLGASLTNRGDEPSEDLRVTVVLRQAESNLVAGRTTVDVGTIRPGRTATVDAEVAVPSDYNYYVDAVLWKDDVMVDTARTTANLDPQRRISVDETTEDVELRVEDFESDDGRPQPTSEPEATTDTSSPGLGVAVAVVALLVSALVARRRSR